MSIYKPSNCHPFASAEDITKCFFSADANGWVKPSPVYITGKIETNNLLTIGYRVRLYISGSLAFESAKISPFSELPAFSEDKTVNTGLNGTYFAVPAFQSSGSNYYETFSYNSIYLTGGARAPQGNATPCFKCDYIIGANANYVPGQTLSGFDLRASGWVGDETAAKLIPPNGWDGKLNGCVVTEGDSILLPREAGPYGYFSIGVMLADGSIKIVAIVSGFTPANPPKGLIYITKGKCCGLYQYYPYGAGYIPLRTDIDWGDMFQSGGAEIAAGDMAGFGNSQLSWEIVLYQGPEDYSGLVTAATTTVPAYFTNGVDGIGKEYYDMKIASGTILGSCAKRLHLRSSLPNENNEYLLPGEDLSSPLVLNGTFCELYWAASSVGSPDYGKYEASHKMTPSFLITGFDSSLGHVYPSDSSGLTQDSLDRFIASVPAGTSLLQFGVFARFFKYSSNATDTLSNEKVRAAFWNTTNVSDNPVTFLRPGAEVDGVIVSTGDRVLWNTSYNQGKSNGIWVIGSENEEPWRPADGDDYADYIGKVVLILEGNAYQSTVAECNAVAGGSYTLGEMGFFFHKQYPIKLNQYSPTGQLEDGSAQVSEAILSGDTLENYLIYSEIDQTWSLEALPVVYQNGKVLINSRVYAYDPVMARYVMAYNVYYLTLDNGKVQMRESSASGYVEYALFTGTLGANTTIYLKGEILTYTNLRKTFSVDSGVCAGSTVQIASEAGDTSSGANFVLYEPSSSALVLQNSATETYLSPSNARLDDTFIVFKNGAYATVSGSPLDHLKIISFDKKFNCATHTALDTPLIAATNEGVTPPTPYKYDILSCYRVSDQNGFTMSLPLTPYIAPTEKTGELISSYNVLADVSCFQGPGKAWNSARLMLGPESGSGAQDTDWFSDRGLDTEFMCLEPGSRTDAYVYAKDSDGRTTAAKRAIVVPPDTAEYIEAYGSKMELALPQEDTFEFSFSLNADLYGFTEDNIDQYLQTIDMSSAGSGGTGSYESLGSYSFSGDELNIRLNGKFSENWTDGEVRVTARIDSPEGLVTLNGVWNLVPSFSAAIFIGSHISSPLPAPIFTGAFPGTLTAEPDCSTQSVLVTYVPSGGTESLKDALPIEQNGTYDVFRREYASFRRSYGTDASMSSGEEEIYMGDWEPAGIGVSEFGFRDFNVKQGHSYQYALVPRTRRGMSLRIERSAVVSEGHEENTFFPTGTSTGFIAFNNALIGARNAMPAQNISISMKNATGAVASPNSPTVVYFDDPSSEGKAAIRFYPNYFFSVVFPVTVDITLNRLGIDYKARVVFTSSTEYTVEPFDDSVSSRARLLANGGDPVYVQWDAWSLTELDEVNPATLFEDPNMRHPAVRKAYKADLDRIWLFRYDAEPGSQAVNVTKGEISTLAKYPRFSSGSLNAESGDVSAWLGSEVVPCSRLGYVERRRAAIWHPLATNEAAAMLAAWRETVASDRPKLLRDRKGRSWIVQISAGSSTTMDNTIGTPSKISFSWKQIGDPSPYAIVYGDGDELAPLGEEGAWLPEITI